MTKNFNKWWNSGKLTDGNPYKEDSPAYWAWEGWAASRDAEIAELKQEHINCALSLDECEQERDQLRAELVNALAACKAKDEALRLIKYETDIHGTNLSKHIRTEAISALAIQPDDAALKAWLGEPVWVAQSETYSQFVNGRPRKVWYECMQGVGIPLYSPKELK